MPRGVPLGVRVGGYAPSDVVPFSCWWLISTETIYIWHNISQPREMRLCRLMGMCWYEFEQGLARRSGASFSEHEVRALSSDKTRKRSRGRESEKTRSARGIKTCSDSCHVHSRNHQHLRGRTSLRESWSAPIHAVSPPTQTLVVRSGIASRSSSFRPILGRRQYDCTCHTNTRVGTSQKTVPNSTVSRHAATEHSWLHTLVGVATLGTVRRPVCWPLAPTRLQSHLVGYFLRIRCGPLTKVGGLVAGALGASFRGSETRLTGRRSIPGPVRPGPCQTKANGMMQRQGDLHK